jgi:hypothetical protein
MCYKAVNDVREVEFVFVFEYLPVEIVQTYSAYFDTLARQLRPRNLHIQTLEGDEVRFAVGFFALEAIYTHSAPERIDYNPFGMHLSADDVFTAVIDYMLGER